MTRRFTWISGCCFSNRLTSAVQYGWVWLLYSAITTLIVPDELPPDPELPLLPPQAATASAVATVTTPAIRPAPSLVSFMTIPPADVADHSNYLGLFIKDDFIIMGHAAWRGQERCCTVH